MEAAPSILAAASASLSSKAVEAVYDHLTACETFASLTSNFREGLDWAYVEASDSIVTLKQLELKVGGLAVQVPPRTLGKVISRDDSQMLVAWTTTYSGWFLLFELVRSILGADDTVVPVQSPSLFVANVLKLTLNISQFAELAAELQAHLDEIYVRVGRKSDSSVTSSLAMLVVTSRAALLLSPSVLSVAIRILCHQIESAPALTVERCLNGGILSAAGGMFLHDAILLERTQGCYEGTISVTQLLLAALDHIPEDGHVHDALLAMARYAVFNVLAELPSWAYATTLDRLQLYYTLMSFVAMVRMFQTFATRHTDIATFV